MFCIYKDGELSPEVDDDCEGGNLRERVNDNASQGPGHSIDRPNNRADHDNQVHDTFSKFCGMLLFFWFFIANVRIKKFTNWSMTMDNEFSVLFILLFER